jgi:glycosyltransferase involved in cell wall biosynthesis
MYSVVIPVYQAKDSLKRCVHSWLAQTERDLELILVDDGSTDGSGALCDALAAKDARIRVIHQENQGVSAARNAGIRAAHGEFLMFMDSDDYAEKNCLERMAAFQKEQDSDLVICGFHHIYDGADIRKVPEMSGTWEKSEFEEPFLTLYEKSYLNMPWNKLYRKDWLGVFDASISLGEDLLFNLEYLAKCSRISVLAEPLCYYIQEEQKVTLSSVKRQNRMELAKRICTAAEQFYETTWGHPHTGGRIFTRYMNEILDECEKLPADKTLSFREKKETILSYAKDPWVKDRGDEAVLVYPDYRILWWFLKRELSGLVYGLCVLRRAVVLVVHGFRRKRK